ncbi:YbaK/EbsC family protein [Pseudonocardia spinosispora]|uniref:YbaK/EbsC family protein n=1 Tax=Pseudonocardia spinosispora TaxID=103441 RepID=UPI00041C87E0|nr:YbaK/EbsC family protein [Pseudonocardia spinosispora]
MSASVDHPNVQAVTAALRSGGAASGSIERMRVLPDAVSTARAAADALEVEVGQIANSLVFDADGEPLLVLASGAHRVDTDLLSAQLGATTISRADAKYVRRVTGQVIGGVAPLGHPAPLRTVVDTALASYDEVWAAGGIPHAVFPTSYRELLTVTGGTAAVVAGER